MNKYKKLKSTRFCIFPDYKWCGPGCSGPEQPINPIDAACKTHDECYESSKDRCLCDQEFLQLLEQYTVDRTTEGRHARIISRYMKVQSKIRCAFK